MLGSVGELLRCYRRLANIVSIALFCTAVFLYIVNVWVNDYLSDRHRLLFNSDHDSPHP